MTNKCNPTVQVRAGDGQLYEIDLGELSRWQELEEFGFRFDEIVKFDDLEQYWQDFEGSWEDFPGYLDDQGVDYDQDFLDGFEDGDQFDEGLDLVRRPGVQILLPSNDQLRKRTLTPNGWEDFFGGTPTGQNPSYEDMFGDPTSDYPVGDPINPEDLQDEAAPEPDDTTGEEVWIEDGSARRTSTIEVEGVEIERIDQLVMVKRKSGQRIRMVFKHPSGS